MRQGCRHGFVLIAEVLVHLQSLILKVWEPMDGEGPDHAITQDHYHELTGNVESLRRVLLGANGLGEVDDIGDGGGSFRHDDVPLHRWGWPRHGTRLRALGGHLKLVAIFPDQELRLGPDIAPGPASGSPNTKWVCLTAISNARRGDTIKDQAEIKIEGRPTWWRRHWRLLVFGVLVLLAYVVAATTVLPQWIVSLSAGQADANTQLSAVINTRAALLGILTPVVFVVVGIAAFLNYRETTEQNRRTSELARLERDEARRLRRVDAYAELLSACEHCVFAADDVYYAKREDPDDLQQRMPLLVKTLLEKRAAMDFAADRVKLLGSDEVLVPANDLDMHCGKEIATKAAARLKLSDEEWKSIRVTEYGVRYWAFLAAARSDLAPTR